MKRVLSTEEAKELGHFGRSGDSYSPYFPHSREVISLKEVLCDMLGENVLSALGTSMLSLSKNLDAQVW